MKKLILSAAIILGAMSVQTANAMHPAVMIQSSIIQDEFTEISADAIPAAVSLQLKNLFQAPN